jgi:hypothetical protein
LFRLYNYGTSASKKINNRFTDLLLSLYSSQTIELSKLNLDKLHKDDPIKFVLHFDSLDQGTEAFMKWLGSDDKISTSSNPHYPKTI